ncbi:hypothetical protein BDV18DRAFT_26484 [Aspergillus unguis]
MLYLLVLVALLAVVSRGADDDNHFTNPATSTGTNQQWKLGEQKVISWETTLETFNISIWQQSLSDRTATSQGIVYSKIHASDNITSFTWVVQRYAFDLNTSNIFFFWVNADTPGGFTSAYFNITQADSDSDSSETDSDTTESPSSNPSLSAPTPTDTGPASASPTGEIISDYGNGLTTTAKVAIGIGVSFGVPIIGLLATILWRTSRSRFQSQSHGSGSFWSRPRETASSGPRLVELLGNTSPPKEVHGTTDPSLVYPELPGGEVERSGHNVYEDSVTGREGNFI